MPSTASASSGTSASPTANAPKSPPSPPSASDKTVLGPKMDQIWSVLGPRTRCAGVDGCTGGWVVAVDGAPPEVIVVPAFVDVLAVCNGVIAVDMPIGLPATGRRACDSE